MGELAPPEEADHAERTTVKKRSSFWRALCHLLAGSSRWLFGSATVALIGIAAFYFFAPQSLHLATIMARWADLGMMSIDPGKTMKTIWLPTPPGAPVEVSRDLPSTKPVQQPGAADEPKPSQAPPNSMNEIVDVLRELLPPDAGAGSLKSTKRAKKSARPDRNRLTPETSAFWNTWFEYQDEPAPTVLTVGNAYTFVLDLSPYEYAKLSRATPAIGASVDPAIAKVISDPSRTRITFHIRPILAENGGLKFFENNDGQIVTDTVTLKTDLQRLRQPDSAALTNYLDRKITLPGLSEKAAAGSTRFTVFAEAAGCTAVVLSILSEDKRLPLDHLVRWVAITRAGETPPRCDEQSAGLQPSLSGGLGNLLKVSLEAAETGATKRAAAAFHIFETRAGSFVVFSDGREAQKRSVYAWQIDGNFAGYLSDEHRLPKAIGAARDAASKGNSGSYANVAQEFATILFSSKNEIGKLEAAAAKQAFQNIAEQSSGRALIVVRAVTDSQQGQNRSLFLPLGILAAEGENRFLKKPIVVMQPLPLERYTSAKACIGDWTIGFPNKLEKVTEDLKSLKPSDPIGTWLDDLAGLSAYLANPAAPSGNRGEGFLLLAHHGHDNLWFDNDASRIVRQSIVRPYPAGSIGVFAACSIAAPGYDSGFIQKFNQLGIDAVIASPFPVPASYGIRFAAEFSKLLKDLQQTAGPATIADVFVLALEQTARRLDQEFHRTYNEMGLEYVLLGNPNIQICTKTETGGQQ